MPWLEDLKFPRGYQMGTHILLLMIVGFVGAKKNVFNDEVNVYASNILLKIGISGLIISSVNDSSPLTGSELLNILVVFSIFTIFTGIVSKIIVEVLHIQENKALWQFIATKMFNVWIWREFIS